jgi:hypothetical protein
MRPGRVAELRVATVHVDHVSEVALASTGPRYWSSSRECSRLLIGRAAGRADIVTRGTSRPSLVGQTAQKADQITKTIPARIKAAPTSGSDH